MPKQYSVGEKIQALEALLDEDVFNSWEHGFVTSIFNFSNGGVVTGRLSEKQLDKIESLWERHCNRDKNVPLSLYSDRQSADKKDVKSHIDDLLK